jgi:UDP-N-acetylglucosamine transferase subunit ALG13
VNGGDPLIFVTVGHTRFAFQRLVDALAALPPARLEVQHGSATPPVHARVSRSFMTFDEVAEHMASADVVICHAGVGSILCAQRAGHVPVVASRLKRFGEAVDDHQTELAESLAARGDVIFCRDLRDLPASVAMAATSSRRATSESSALALAVRADILGSRS